MELFIIRGLPNSGKTTLGRKLAPLVYSADDYFDERAAKENTDYKTAFAKYRNFIGDAHQQCQENVEVAMMEKAFEIAVANTFTTVREMTPYLNLARKYGYQVTIMTVEKCHEGDNNHGVPDDTIKKMAKRWQMIDERFQ